MSYDHIHQLHRTLRSKRAEALQRGSIAILEMGTTKIACLVLKFEAKPGAEALGRGSLTNRTGFKIIGSASTPARGIKFGEVESISDATGAIRSAIAEAQRVCGERIDHVVACFSGGQLISNLNFGEVDLGENPVNELDIARALAASEAHEPSPENEVIHAQPVNFSVDHRSGMFDPRGHRGKRLAADLHILSLNRNTLGNFSQCVENCNVELAGVTTSAYVSGISSLVEDEQELGAACVDIGGGVTAISIFFKKHMLFAEGLPLGGNDITSDISAAFSVSERVAEGLKISHGGVIATSEDDLDCLPYDQGPGWPGPPKGSTRSQLIGVIRPRVEEILENVKSILEDASFNKLTGQRVVLTGGSSVIPGLEDLAREKLGHPIRSGRPMRIAGLPQAMSGPEYASTVGLTMFAAHPEDEWWDFPDPRLANPPTKLVGRLMHRIKEYW